MVSQLEKLKAEKIRLLKKKGLKQASLKTLSMRRAEERKIKAEIFALKHPESAQAKARFISAVKNFGRAVASTSKTVSDNIVRQERARRARDAKERSELRKIALVRARGSKKKNKRRSKIETFF